MNPATIAATWTVVQFCACGFERHITVPASEVEAERLAFVCSVCLRKAVTP